MVLFLGSPEAQGENDAGRRDAGEKTIWWLASLERKSEISLEPSRTWLDMANHETLGRSPRHRAEVTPRVREETPGNV